MLSALMNIAFAAIIGACAGLLWYGLTKIPPIQRQFQKFPKWVGIVVVLGVVKIFHPMLEDAFNSFSIPRNSYDQDFTQQCLVLKDAFPALLKADELEKVRSITNAKDPEMMRAYLLGLTRAEEAELEKVAMRSNNKAASLKWIHCQSIVQFYEEWERPSPQGRAEYARKRGEEVAKIFERMPDQDYTVSAKGPGSSILVLHMKKPGNVIAQLRDNIVVSLGSSSAQKYPNSVWAVGFTMHRLEDSEGKGFTIKGTPKGAELPLAEDDFK